MNILFIYIILIESNWWMSGIHHRLIFILCYIAVTHDDALCVIANPAFVVYSSIVSFYVPFIITLLVYVQIYVVLRKRRKRVNTKRTFPVTDVDMSSTIKVLL